MRFYLVAAVAEKKYRKDYWLGKTVFDVFQLIFSFFFFCFKKKKYDGYFAVN